MNSPGLLHARIQSHNDTATLRRIYGSVRPQAFLERLDQIEAGCITTLERAGCWEAGCLLSLRYWESGKEAVRENHKARAAKKMRIVHAWECLCLVRDLKAMVHKGGADATKIATAAMLVESKLVTVVTEVEVAKAHGSLRDGAESETNKLSALLYLFARAAYRDKAEFGDSKKNLTTAGIYMELRKDDSEGESYDPGVQKGAEDALRQQAARWRKWGLC